MSDRDRRNGALRWPFALLAYSCVGLAAVGVLVPGLPTVPFLLVAAWAAARGSDRLSAWIDDHRHFGTLVRDWREQRAVPVRAKLGGVALLMVSWSIVAWSGPPRWLLWALGALFLTVAAFLLSRPIPGRGQK